MAIMPPSRYALEMPTAAPKRAAPKPPVPSPWAGGYVENPSELGPGIGAAPGVARPSGGIKPKAPGPKPIDYSNDSLLQAFLAGFRRDNSQDEAGTRDKQKRLLMGFGSKELAQKLLGNDPWAETVDDSPFSFLANMKRNYDQTVASTNDLLNKRNLWYSGHRGKQLGNLATAHMGDVNTASQNIENLFLDLADGLVGRQNARLTAKGTAEAEAKGRYEADALASGAAPPGAAAAPGAAAGAAGAGGKVVTAPTAKPAIMSHRQMEELAKRKRIPGVGGQMVAM